MGVSLKGIHFHCGSGQHGSSAFGKAVNCKKMFGNWYECMDTK
jgi:diaminopimelate decarboxylase